MMSATVIFSNCQRYRYVLERDLVEPLLMPKVPSVCAFVGLNPSTADEKDDDPTIRRCKSFARTFGFSRLRMLNLYAWRSTDPRALAKADDPVGPENDAHLLAGTADAGLILCAWGVNAKEEREAHVVRLLRAAGRNLRVLRWTPVTQKPEHPLFVPGDVTPLPYEERQPRQ